MNRDRLARLVAVKQRIRAAHQNLLSSAVADLRSAEAVIETERQSARSARDRLATAALTSADELAGLAMQVEHGQHRIAAAAKQRDGVAERAEVLRTMLVEAAHDSKRMECLHERAQREHHRRVRRLEQIEIDEVASRIRRPQ